MAQNLQAASVGPAHVQLNYRQGQSYTVDAEGREKWICADTGEKAYVK